MISTVYVLVWIQKSLRMPLHALLTQDGIKDMLKPC